MTKKLKRIVKQVQLQIENGSCQGAVLEYEDFDKMVNVIIAASMVAEDNLDTQLLFNLDFALEELEK